MVAYIKGTLVARQLDTVIIENHDIGYEIRIPLSVCEQLPALGSNVTLFTYLYVREDVMQLYGFLHMQDAEVFKLLLTVSGIGPKAALGILSSITPDDLRFAILSEDKKTIAKAPGIGAKTAGKLILELKDKFHLEDAFSVKQSHQQDTACVVSALQETDRKQIQKIQKEACEALCALGYSQTDAMQAVHSVSMDEIENTEQLLKAALKKFSKL